MTLSNPIICGNCSFNSTCQALIMLSDSQSPFSMHFLSDIDNFRSFIQQISLSGDTGIDLVRSTKPTIHYKFPTCHIRTYHWVE